MGLIEKLEKLKRERKSLYIPELDETVYWYPMTAGERQRILTAAGFKYSRDTVFLDNAKYKTSLIIEKLEDKDGKKIFQNIPEHKDLLMNRINDELLTRIANAIDPPRTEEEVIDEAKKRIREPFYRGLMVLADKKGKFVYEFIEDLPEDEMYDWFAYYEEQYQEMERERAKHRRR